MQPAPQDLPKPKNPGMAGNLFSIGIVILVAAICVLNFLSGARILPKALNSDLLLMPAALEDMLRQGGKQADWYLSPPPYWFPDYLLFLPGFAVVDGPYLQLAVYTAVQILTFSGILYGLLRVLDVRAPALSMALIVAVFAWLALPAVEPFSIFLVPETHFGAFMASLLTLTLVVRIRQTGITLSAMLIIAGIVAMTVFSDDMFTGHTTFAMLVLFLLLGASAASAERRIAFKMAGLFLVAGLIGTAGYWLIIVNPKKYGFGFDIYEMPARLVDLGAIYGRSLDANPLPALIAPAMIFVGLVVLAKLLWSRAGWTNDGFSMAVSFMGLSGALTVALALGNANLPLAERYFLTVLAVPVILAIAGAARLMPRRLDPILGVAAAGFVALSGWQTATQIQQNGLHAVHYPDQIACIDKALAPHDAKRGVAHFWEARPITAFNRSGAIVAPVFTNLQPDRWHVSEKSFQEAYDFAVVRTDATPYETLSVTDVRKYSGPAITETDCGNVRVLVYAKGGIRVPKEP